MATPTPDDIASDVRERSNTALKRGLASRHMQMIAIGGAIGTGLFLASGATVANAGPGGALLAYAAIGLMVLLLMQSLGEMSAHSWHRASSWPIGSRPCRRGYGRWASS